MFFDEHNAGCNDLSLRCGESRVEDPCSSHLCPVTNDDNVNHNTVSFYEAGGTESAPQLTYNNAVETGGTGINGGYFGTSRVKTAADSSAQCLYASDAGSATIAGIVIQTQQAAGSFSGSASDAGDVNGIGLAVSSSLPLCRIHYFEHDWYVRDPARVPAIVLG